MGLVSSCVIFHSIVYSCCTRATDDLIALYIFLQWTAFSISCHDLPPIDCEELKECQQLRFLMVNAAHDLKMPLASFVMGMDMIRRLDYMNPPIKAFG
jgi:hypothetical protein